MIEARTETRQEQPETNPLPQGQEERRRVRRTALRLNATVREFGRSRVAVRVIDISTHGCRIETPSDHVAESWLWLSIAGLQTQYCRVAWQRQEFIGLEFAAPLNEAVLDNLLAAQSRLTETAVKELRDIAARTHRLAKSGREADEHRELLDLSRDCTVHALSLGLTLCEGAPAEESCAQLTGSLIRRGMPETGEVAIP